MATYYVGINKGQDSKTITSGTSTTGKDVEISINLSNFSVGESQESVNVLLTQLFTYIADGKFKPV